jgi:AcrR family transcriptional regulator
MIRYRIEMKNATSTSGRPRDLETRNRILGSVFAVLMNDGYEALAIESVAKHAQVGKTTIYRWWRNKAYLAIDAFFEQTKGEIEFPDTGSVELDFKVQLLKLGELLRSPKGAVIISLIIGARHDEELRRELFQSWIKPRKVWGEQKMKLIEPKNFEVALNSLYGPLYSPLLFGLDPLTPDAIEKHCNHFFAPYQKKREEKHTADSSNW